MSEKFKKVKHDTSRFEQHVYAGLFAGVSMTAVRIEGNRYRVARSTSERLGVNVVGSMVDVEARALEIATG